MGGNHLKLASCLSVFSHLVLRRALWPLLGLRVVLGAEAVHELVDEVEDAHAQRDALLLTAPQGDEQRVEAVRVLVSPCRGRSLCGFEVQGGPSDRGQLYVDIEIK